MTKFKRQQKDDPLWLVFLCGLEMGKEGAAEADTQCGRTLVPGSGGVYLHVPDCCQGSDVTRDPPYACVCISYVYV